jgi:CDP-glycerol glycerophosphotransferase (TagB/SpsB family)
LDAAVLDRPKILTGLSGAKPTPDDGAIAATYEYEFYKRTLETEGIRVSYVEKNFIDLIAGYMKDPSKDHEGRKKIVDIYLGKLDGNAGNRIAETILSVATQK